MRFLRSTIFITKQNSICTKLVRCIQHHVKGDNTGFTNFGFEKVTEEEHTQKVHQLFENVANNYDQMNDVLSLGIHRVWKDIFVNRLGPTKGTQLLDVAGGTGDIAFRFLDHIKKSGSQENSHVTVCDINTAMLDVGKARSRRSNYDPNLISWEIGNAEKLSFPDESFNAYTIAFGVRNITRVDKVINEAYRVLKPGGRFMCLEFSHLECSSAQWLYDQYSFQIIPILGQLLAGKWQEYRYLVESIKKFPDQETLKSLIETGGFRQVTYENLTLGIVSIHSGFKF